MLVGIKASMLEGEETAETIHTSVQDVLPVVSHRQD